MNWANVIYEDYPKTYLPLLKQIDFTFDVVVQVSLVHNSLCSKADRSPSTRLLCGQDPKPKLRFSD